MHPLRISLLICYFFNVNRIDYKIVRRRTELMHQQRVSRSESRSYWTCRRTHGPQVPL